MQAANLKTEQQEWLTLTYDTPYVYGLRAGFDKLALIHNEWIRAFVFNDEDMTLQAHRNSYKTTCLSIAIALLMILQPDKAILFMRKTDTDVREILTQVSKLLMHSDYQQLAFALWGKPLILTRNTAGEIDTSIKQSPRGTSQLVGSGVGGSLTGKHYDVIVTDDIVNLNDRISKADREKTKLVYQELQNIKNAGGRIINTGTPWHVEDAFTLMPNIQKFDCYSTGMMDEAEIEDKRQKMSASLFAANYELKHISDADRLFSNPVIDDGTNTEKIYHGICHVDAAYGGTDGTAFTIAKQHADGNIYVYGLLRQQHVDKVLPEIERRRIMYLAGTLYNETNGDKGYLIRKIAPPTKGYHERMNKYIKISTIVHELWDKIVFIKDTDPDYISEVLEYSENASSDDAPDSLASLLRVLINYKPQTDLSEQMKMLKQLGL